MIRCFDIFFSVIAILILSPLFVAVALILKLTGEGEVFYLQERLDNLAILFVIKFATMLKNSPSMGWVNHHFS